MKQWLKQQFLKWNHRQFEKYNKDVQSNLVYFESFHGKQYSDNPKAIYETMLHIAPHMKGIWGVKKGYEAPFKALNIPYVIRFSKEWYQTVAKARFWIINTRTKTWIEKASHTTYIQTWHGTPLKHIGLDIEDAKIGDMTSTTYKQSVKEETALWDFVVSPSSYTTQALRSAFQLEEEQILEVGYPRNDRLCSPKEDEIQSIKQALSLPKDKKVILYAPTWRETGDNTNQYHFDLPFCLDTFEQQFGDECILLLRMHYLVAESFDLSQYASIQDVSKYGDMADLLLIADLLITDYSSCFFDYALLQRPMLFFMPDRLYYEKQLRGLYIQNIEQVLPGPIVEKESQLYEYITKWQQGNWTYDAMLYQTFSQRFNHEEHGTAGRSVVQFLQHLQQMDQNLVENKKGISYNKTK